MDKNRARQVLTQELADYASKLPADDPAFPEMSQFKSNLISAVEKLKNSKPLTLEDKGTLALATHFLDTRLPQDQNQIDHPKDQYKNKNDELVNDCCCFMNGPK